MGGRELGIESNRNQKVQSMVSNAAKPIRLKMVKKKLFGEANSKNNFSSTVEEECVLQEALKVVEREKRRRY